MWIQGHFEHLYLLGEGTAFVQTWCFMSVFQPGGPEEKPCSSHLASKSNLTWTDLLLSLMYSSSGGENASVWVWMQSCAASVDTTKGCSHSPEPEYIFNADWSQVLLSLKWNTDPISFSWPAHHRVNSCQKVSLFIWYPSPRCVTSCLSLCVICSDRL